MAHFQVQASYTSHSWAALVKKPEDEEARLRSLVEKSGGKLVALFFSVGGEHDILGIVEAPSVSVAAALTVVLQKAGHLTNVRLTPLLTSQEMVAVLKIAAAVPSIGPGETVA